MEISNNINQQFESKASSKETEVSIPFQTTTISKCLCFFFVLVTYLYQHCLDVTDHLNSPKGPSSFLFHETLVINQIGLIGLLCRISSHAKKLFTINHKKIMRKHLLVNYVINLYIGKQPFSDTFLIFIDITKYIDLLVFQKYLHELYSIKNTTT